MYYFTIVHKKNSMWVFQRHFIRMKKYNLYWHAFAILYLMYVQDLNIVTISLTRTQGSCSNQYSHSSWQCIGDGGGANEPWGTAANCLPNCCQPLSEWAFQFAATRGAGETSCLQFWLFNMQTHMLIHMCLHVWGRSVLDVYCSSMSLHACDSDLYIC